MQLIIDIQPVVAFLYPQVDTKEKMTVTSKKKTEKKTKQQRRKERKKNSVKLKRLQKKEDRIRDSDIFR